MRPGRLSDTFVKPYPNVEGIYSSKWWSVSSRYVRAYESKKGWGRIYVYSLLLGYEEAPTGFELDEGVYYNKYMPGNKIKMIGTTF